jgi:hypothetical protein
MSEQENSMAGAARVACRAFDQELAAYLDGEDKPRVLAHAQECPFCGVVLADMEQIQRVSRDLPLLEPPSRLWANVRATLASEGVIHDPFPAWQRWIPRLTFVREPQPLGALAGLAVLALVLLNSPRSFETSSASGILPEGELVLAAGFVPELTPALADTVSQMEVAYQARESSLEPALKATYQRSLRTLDATIQECIRQCKREPGNALARQYLMHAYQSKAEVLASALEFNR